MTIEKTNKIIDKEEELIYLGRDLGRVLRIASDEDLAQILLLELGAERVGKIIKILLNK